ncbi:MAG: adenylate/guanylate cyclase domain-containing protein [Nocardia sp.]|nr:adenylate/guanylate cyclase domain-containing protein [Nocardia sp.]
MTSRLVLWALRSRFGLSAVVMACHMGGLAVIIVGLWLSGFIGRLGPHWIDAIAQASVYPLLAALLGVVLAVRDRIHYFSWIDNTRKPTPAEAARLAALPMTITIRGLVVWLPGVVLATAIFTQVVPLRALWAIGAMFMLGALESAGFTFLVVDRLIRPTVPVISRILGGRTHWSSTVLHRVAITWGVAAAMPLLMLITVLGDPVAAAQDRMRTAIYMSLVGLVVGTLATGTLARSVAVPLVTLRRALDRIARGELSVRVPVTTTSEIGRLEHSVNELAENLAERDRMREVFGRHVGTEVAERALARGVDLTGDVRVVTALFVDVTGSVELSTRLAPQEFVERLNRLLSVVVSATEDNGGLVNKFEGDAALCIFGAPITLEDNATPALRAARRIRDEVNLGGEFDIGIGVARGSVFAGDIGSENRLEFTVIGDAVNQASRLTGEAKQVPRRILAGRTVIDAAAASERSRWACYQAIQLRGRNEPTECWTDHKPPDPVDDDAPRSPAEP